MLNFMKTEINGHFTIPSKAQLDNPGKILLYLGFSRCYMAGSDNWSSL